MDPPLTGASTSPRGLDQWNLQNVVLLSYTLVDEVHSLVDEPQPFRSRLDRRVRNAAVVGLIFFGTLISTLGKLAYEIQAVGRDGTTRPFQKPLLLVLLMFVGMSLNLPLSLFLDLVRRHRRSKRIPRQPMYVPLLHYDNDDEEIYQPPLLLDSATAGGSSGLGIRRRLIHKQLLLLLVPTLFDLLGSALLNVGLLAVTASAAAMLRQSLLLFAALLGVGLWGKRLNRFHAAGLAGCMAGLMMVAAASLASGFGGSTAPHSRALMAAGIGLVLASQLAAAGQMLIDHGWASGQLQLSPLKIVGCEGLLGMVLMLLVVLPLADVSSIGSDGWGLSEDCWDSLVMIASRPLLQLLLLAYTASLQAYNLCGMVTAGELSAVDTTLLQAVRTLFVWMINLLIYAVASALVPEQPPEVHQTEPLLQPDALGAPPAVSGGQPLKIQMAAAARLLFLQPSGLPLQVQQQLQDQQSSFGRHVQAADMLQLTSAAATTGASSSLWHLLLQGWSGFLQGLPQQQQQQMVSVHSSSLSGYAGNAALGVGVLAQAAGLGAGFQLSDVSLELPGEPWLGWSFLQAAGFLVLVIAAVTYSKGDSEGLRKQLQDEAALIMLDQPPGSVAGSFHSTRTAGRHFTAHMDIDTAAFLHSFSRGRDREQLYGITPSSHSLNFAADSSMGRHRSPGGLLQSSAASPRDSLDLYGELEDVEEQGPAAVVPGPASAGLAAVAGSAAIMAAGPVATGDLAPPAADHEA